MKIGRRTYLVNMHNYACKNWRFYVKPLVRSTYSYKLQHTVPTAKIKLKSGNPNPTMSCNFPFSGTSNVCPIWHNFRKIRNRNVHDLDLDLQNGSVTNIDMPMERPYAIFDLLTIVIFALSVTICEKFVIEMCMTFTVTFRMAQFKI